MSPECAPMPLAKRRSHHAGGRQNPEGFAHLDTGVAQGLDTERLREAMEGRSTAANVEAADRPEPGERETPMAECLGEPPSLREFLAAGCDLAAVDGLDPGFVVDLIDIPSRTPERVAMWVGFYRETVAAWVRGEISQVDRMSTRPRQHTQGEVCEFAFAADALEDPGLAESLTRWTTPRRERITPTDPADLTPPHDLSAARILAACDALRRFADSYLATLPADVSPAERERLARAAELIEEALGEFQ
jgi:hypothetical protein